MVCSLSSTLALHSHLWLYWPRKWKMFTLANFCWASQGRTWGEGGEGGEGVWEDYTEERAEERTDVEQTFCSGPWVMDFILLGQLWRRGGKRSTNKIRCKTHTYFKIILYSSICLPFPFIYYFSTRWREFGEHLGKILIFHKCIKCTFNKAINGNF